MFLVFLRKLIWISEICRKGEENRGIKRLPLEINAMLAYITFRLIIEQKF